MQILTDRQVKYCGVVVEKSGVRECLPGMSFQHKIFLKQKFFPVHELHNALNYCQQKYLDAAGKKLYLIVKGKIGFDVWVETKSARILGDRAPTDTIDNLDLEDLVDKLSQVAEIEFNNCQDNFLVGDRKSVRREANEDLFNNLEVSLKQAIDLGQKIINREWSDSAAARQFVLDGRIFPHFYSDEI